jgi:hypothetical protein
MRWQIFYGDGSEYKDCDGPPELAPKRNVQTIAVENGIVGRRLERGDNFYIMTDHSWRGCDQFGLYDYLIEPGAKIVLFGRSLNDAEYREILDRSARSDYLPVKNAWLPEERKP